MFMLIFVTLFLKYTSTEAYIANSKFEADFYKLYKKEVSPHNFKYIINPGHSVCERSKVFLLVYIHSAPENHKNRIVLRETWLNKRLFPELRHVFMLGQSKNSQTNDRIKLESNIYEDIVQESFLDTYYNLTVKSVMAVKWISKYCEKVHLVLKVDDDMLVNMFFLIRHLKKSFDFKEFSDDDVIMCKLFKHAKVIRDPRSKWYLSENEFKSSYFPEYCSGSAFLFSGSLAKSLYYGATHVKFFWIDDFFLTHLAAQAIGYKKYKAINSLYELDPQKVEDNFKAKKFAWITFGHMSHDKQMRGIDKMKELWTIILQRNNINL
jgi:beta-1,3-galactosyltransferase 1